MTLQKRVHYNKKGRNAAFARETLMKDVIVISNVYCAGVKCTKHEPMAHQN